MKTDFLLKRLLFSSEKLSHHCRVNHSENRVCGDKEMKRGKHALKKLRAAETLNNIKILSQKRQQQVSYFNVCLLSELNNFLRKIMVKIEA